MRVFQKNRQSYKSWSYWPNSLDCTDLNQCGVHRDAELCRLCYKNSYESHGHFDWEKTKIFFFEKPNNQKPKTPKKPKTKCHFPAWWRIGFWFLVFGFWLFFFKVYFFPMKISLAFIWGIIYFCTMYGWFLQNLGKDFRTNMHTTVYSLPFHAPFPSFLIAFKKKRPEVIFSIMKKLKIGKNAICKCELVFGHLLWENFLPFKLLPAMFISVAFFQN